MAQKGNVDVVVAPKLEDAFISDVGNKTALLCFDGESRIVHQNVLQQSKVLAKALDGTFKEATEEKIEVQGRASIVNLIIGWLYRHELPSREYMEKVDVQPTITDMPHPLSDGQINGYGWGIVAIECYIFADQYDIPGLREQLVKMMHGEIKDLKLLPQEAWLITTHLPSSSKLYKLAVDAFVCGNYYEAEDEDSILRQGGWEHLDAEFWHTAMLRIGAINDDFHHIHALRLPPVRRYKED